MRQKARIKRIGDQSLQDIEKCLIWMPNTRVRVLRDDLQDDMW